MRGTGTVDALGDKETTEQAGPIAPSATPTAWRAEPEAPGGQEKTRRLRGHLARQLLFELALPLGGYYGLRALGVGSLPALILGGLLTVPWIGYGMVRNRRIEAMPVFTLALLLVGALMSVVTGDPRVLLIRDGWLTALVGLWMLGTLFTSRPFMRTASVSIVVAKIGEAGAREWDARWHDEPDFRHRLRALTAVWGLGLALDAVVRVVLAYTLPLDAIPLASTVQWLVVLAGIIVFHVRYIKRHGLQA